MARSPLISGRPWLGARIVLGVAGGVAAYKSVQLARDLTRLGAEVDVILTRSALQFVAPLSFEAVTGRPVHQKLLVQGGAALHIGLARDADVFCLAPATADLISRVAHGRAGDLLAAALLGTQSPVVVCPAMNDRMYAHPQTQANLRRLSEVHGYQIVGPAVGPLAVGEGEGPGRMMEPETIVEYVGRSLGRTAPWTDLSVLVTAGPTREAIDPVRYLGNRSSGRMGYAIAQAAWRRGATVTLVSGPTELPDPVGVDTVRVEDARSMAEVVVEAAPEADVLIFAAAVADYRPSDPSPAKIKTREAGAALTLALEANPDIAASTVPLRRAGAISVGFALETDDLVANAEAKRLAKELDLVIANPANEEGVGFGGDDNRAVILSASSEAEHLPKQSKSELADVILDRVERIGEWD